MKHKIYQYIKIDDKTYDISKINEIVNPICPMLVNSSTSSTSSTSSHIKDTNNGVDKVTMSEDKNLEKVTMVTINDDDVDTWEKSSNEIGHNNDDTINAYNYFAYRYNKQIKKKQKNVLLYSEVQK